MNTSRIMEFAGALTLPDASVEFKTDNVPLRNLFDKAENLAAGNVRIFPPDFQVLIESAGYSRLYTETQPMGGEMYAKRNLRVALNNQLLFMLCQRADGRLSGGIFPPPENLDWRKDQYCRWASPEWLEEFGLLADFGHFQGNALPYPAFKLYYLIGKPEEYLRILAESLEAFDAYLWKTRDPYNEGVLQTWCLWDTGEDNCSRFGGSPNCWPHDYPPDGEHTPDPGNLEDRAQYYPRSHVPEDAGKESVIVPFRSMDMMAYSYDNRAVLAMISEELGDGKADYWKEQAEKVRASFKEHLWRPGRGAAFDRDRNNEFMDVLIHNNLRCMWHGMFDQEMADEFVSRHLFNPEEFFTPVPLPSIAANNPLFRNALHNDWSGTPQGLTWQRLVRALENYGKFSELTRLGRIFMEVVGNAGVFVQQYDAFNPENPVPEQEKKRNGYGPTVLTFLELVSRFHGIHVEKETVYWSGLSDGCANRYLQRFGKQTYELKNDGETFTALINDEEKFTCSSGVRVCSDVNGVPGKIVGIDTAEHEVSFCFDSIKRKVNVKPNQIVSLK